MGCQTLKESIALVQIFTEIHVPGVDFARQLEAMTVGVLAGGARPTLRPREDSVEGIEAFRGRELDSPFPSSRFHGTGLEAFRFGDATNGRTAVEAVNNSHISYSHPGALMCRLAWPVPRSEAASR